MERDKKKGRSLFNVFDIVLIVIAVALAAVIFLSRGSSSALTLEPRSVTVHYTVEIRELDQDFRDVVAPGDAVMDRIKKYNIGTVESVSYGEAVRSVEDFEAGIKRLAPVPGCLRMDIAITAQATVSDSAITVDGGYDVRVGAEANIATPGFSGTGVIIAVERVD